MLQDVNWILYRRVTVDAVLKWKEHPMRKNLLAATAIALVASTGAAFAADLPSRKAAPVYVAPPPPPLWTGFYVGLNAGGTFGGSQSTNVGTYGLQSVVAWWRSGCGFGLGARRHKVISRSATAASSVVARSATTISSTTTSSLALKPTSRALPAAAARRRRPQARAFPASRSTRSPRGVTTSKSLDYLGTVRGRIGYLVTPTLLLYGTGGLAYGGANSSTSVFQGISGPTFGITTAFGTAGSYSDTLVGWTAGGGLEWMFAPNWSAKLEYLYYDLGTASYGSWRAAAALSLARGSFFTQRRLARRPSSTAISSAPA